jgi:transcription-repair coupling factor (superfamily II helicase)
MRLKRDMRQLQLRTLETGAGKLVFNLGADARLDGPRLARLVQASNGLYRLTPDMKFVVRIPESLNAPSLIVEAQKALRDLFSVEAR